MASPASPPINLTPEETRQTIELLRACDKALGSAQQAHTIDQFVQTKQDELLKAQSVRIVELEERQSSLLQSPLLWFVAGMLTTGLTVHLVK